MQVGWSALLRKVRWIRDALRGLLPHDSMLGRPEIQPCVEAPDMLEKKGKRQVVSFVLCKSSRKHQVARRKANFFGKLIEATWPPRMQMTKTEFRH